MPRSGLTGTRIRERRLARGVRQADLASKVGISPAYLNLIEHNRRRIGGKILVDLARCLDVDPIALSEGAESSVIAALREAASAHPRAGAETVQSEEFVGRFPGWARLVTDSHRRIAELEHTVERLSDRLAHDPMLSASLHEVLTAVTAIRSTAAILAETEDIDPEWRGRFHRNLREEGSRLADGAQALAAYLDDSADGGVSGPSPREELEVFLTARGFHFPELEDEVGDADDVLGNASGLTSASAIEMARAFLARYQADARRLPLHSLLSVVREVGLDPAQISARFSADLATIFRRLATLPAEEIGTDVGLVLCDGSGTLTLRKPVPGFSLPRFGPGCPLLPLYSAFSRAMAPLQSTIRLPGQPEQRFLTYSVCNPVETVSFTGPQVLESTMLILPPPAAEVAEDELPVGVSCRICPRRDCRARNEPSIVVDGF